MMTSDSLISVIVPCARPERVEATIVALLRQDFPAGEYELIVVVPDETAASAVRAPHISVVVAGQLFPPGRMRNIGARSAAGNYYYFIDDDCIPPESWLSRMEYLFRNNPKTGEIGCRVVSAAEGFWSRCADYALFSSYQLNDTAECALGSAAIAVRKEAFNDVGGFDETLHATEDWDFSLKLKSKGWKCLFDPVIEVKHNHRRDSFIKIVKQGWHSGRLSGLVIPRRHYSGMTWLAKLSVMLGSKWLYWFLILPYACANTILQTIPFVKNNPVVLLYSPVIFCSRFAYHLGVWYNLL
jgi:glycosyltransferase involved in cell wall biosynthesis